MNPDFRTERDALGELKVPAQALYGIHTVRAMENFPLARRPIHSELVRAYGAVKLACATVNRELDAWNDDPAKAEAILRACSEMDQGSLTNHIRVDLLQGGAGTSANMNVNEVLANRALTILGKPLGQYEYISPLDDINLHQSTNDTFPTAMKLAAIRLLGMLESSVVALQESFQAAEKRFAGIVKIARTQLQDAVLITLGREMAAYAEAINRDRWRIYKCQERLRVVNLGGTAIGSGLAAPRQYIFRVVDALKDITGIGFARAENLVECTQNADVYAEVSGILKAHAVSLLKICTDLRIASSGPDAGFGELKLPPRQVGSSIMPAKVNPVIPEAVSQVAMLVFGFDQTIAQACAAGNFELNPFLPLVAACLLDSIDMLARADDILRKFCIEGLAADEARCRNRVESATATATALVSALGHETACRLAEESRRRGISIREIALNDNLLTAEQFDALISPEAVCRLGSPDIKHREGKDA
jgi:aspartate ammonia-lyase